MKIKKGDAISIMGEKYDVLSSVLEGDKFNYETGELSNKHWELDLIKVGENKLNSTHILRIYIDGGKSGRIILYDLLKNREIKLIESDIILIK